MNRYAQLVSAAVVAAVLIVGAILIFRPGGGPGVAADPSVQRPSPPAAPLSTPSAPSAVVPSASATPIALSPTDVGRTLPAGTYRAATFAAPFTITLPAGWAVTESGPNNINFALQGQGPINVYFAVIDKVYPDPCHPVGATRAVGSGVDGLLAALSSMKGFKVTSASDVAIGGATGKSFTLGNSFTADSGCTGGKVRFATYKTGSGAADLEMFPEERDLTWALDAGGTTVMIFVNDSAASVQASQPVLTVSFDNGAR